MRGHLQAITKIQFVPASGAFDKAADVAEKRLGLSALQREGANALTPHMPMAMRHMEMQLHRAASHSAMVARDSEIDGNTRLAVGALVRWRNGASPVRPPIVCARAWRRRAAMPSSPVVISVWPRGYQTRSSGTLNWA